MAIYQILTVDLANPGKRQRVQSDANTWDFLSVRIGVDNLEIKDTGGNFDFGSKRLTLVADPVSAQDAATKNFLVVNYLALAGGTMSGAIAMGANKITGLAAGTVATDAVNYGQVILASGANAFTANQSMGSNKITSLANGTANGDAVNFGQLSAVSGGSITLSQNHIFVGNASNVSTDVAMSGEASIVASGAVTLSNAAVIAKVLTGYVAGAGTVAATDSIIAAIQKVDGNDALKIPLTQKGAALGVATLDASSKIPVAQLPNSVMELKGAYNATTNTPTLVDGTGNPGDIWEVTVAGTQNFGSGAITFVVGDWVVYGAAAAQWYHSPGSNEVSSVNGAQGAVTVNAINQLTGHITAGPASGSQSQVATISSGVIVNSMVGASAAIAYSKLNLSNSLAASDLTTGVFDQVTITGGNGTAASVNYALSFTNDNASAITVNKVVYVKTNGHVDLAIASLAALYNSELGVVQDASIASAGSGKIAVRRGDIIGGFSGLTPGALELVHPTTAGSITESLASFTAGMIVYAVGRAVSATQISYNPEYMFTF